MSNTDAKPETIKAITDKQTGMERFSFGKGAKNLIILPGLSISPISGMAGYVMKRYESLTDDFTITVFDKPMSPPQGYSIKDMAAGIATSMGNAGISSAAALGTSQGGMIAQQLALDYPDAVDALVLCATTCEVKGQTYDVITKWIQAAERRDRQELARLFINGIYSPAVAKSMESEMTRMISGISNSMLDRFAILGKSCLSFDLAGSVASIKCKTLVLGSEGDKITLPEGAINLSKLIEGSILHMYGKEYGHCLADETPDFPKRVKEFLSKA